jgi:hypothetical protein
MTIEHDLRSMIATYSAAAERQGLTLSAWVREACDLAVARGSSR